MTPYPWFHVYLYGPGGGPMTSRFDDVAQRLLELRRLHFEPDGSLLWAGGHWQVDGMIYDRCGILQYADLKGRCPLEDWQLLIQRIAGPASPATVLRLSDQSLHDLQTFEKLTWPDR